MKKPIASSIMSKNLITIANDATMKSAYTLMQDKSIRHLPVTDRTGRIIGILSDRDMQRAALRKSNETNYDNLQAMDFQDTDKTQEFMSWPVKSVLDSTSVKDIAQQMLREKISAFLVSTSTGTIRGIITTDDMLKLLINLLDKDPNRIKLSLGGLMDEVSQDYGAYT